MHRHQHAKRPIPDGGSFAAIRPERWSSEQTTLRGMSPETLEHVVRYAGLAVSLVGAFVVSPAATIDLVRRTTAAAVQAGQRAGRYLGMIKPKALTISVGSGIGLVSGVGTVTGTGTAWVPDETVDAKIERLRNRLDQTDALLAQTRVEANNDKQAAAQTLASARDALQKQHDQLTARVTANQQAVLATDRRALPVVGIGVLLSGLAPDLGTRSLLAWSLIAIAVFLSGKAVLDARHDRVTTS